MLARYDALLGVQGAEDKAEHYLYERHRINPSSIWNVYIPGNAEREVVVNFEEFVLDAKQHLSIDIEELSTFQFFVLRDKLKKNKKHGNN